MTETGAFPWIKNYPSDIQWDVSIQDIPVYEMLDQTASKYPDFPAFDFLGEKMTWKDMQIASCKFAKGLQKINITKGTKVGIFLPNCPFFVIAYYALMRVGAIVVNYNPLYAKSELADMIENSETDVVVTLDLEMLYGKMERMLSDTRLEKLVVASFVKLLPFPKNILFQLFKRKELANFPKNSRRIFCCNNLMDNDGQYDPVEIDPKNDIALFQFTGGTTGVPKAAMLTHRNLVANAHQAGVWLRCKEAEDKMLGVLPFFHVFAMTGVMNLSVHKAMEIIAIPRFELDQTLALIHKKKPTIFPGVPAIFNGINNHKKLSKFDLSSLKYCVSGGAPLPLEVKNKFEKKTGSILGEGYGLTESSPIVSCHLGWDESKAGSIGMPLQNTIVDIVDPETGLEVPIGERGELCVRGPQVMKGYWNAPDETAATIKGGRLHTGDIAIMDEDGYIFIVDRIKDLIITNGYNVYPRHVEEAIYQHPSVEECIVAGLPDTQRGEVVKAWIKCKDDRCLGAEDLKVFLKDKLSPMEMPKRIEFRQEALPKTMIGKLSRKDIVAEELAEKDGA